MKLEIDNRTPYLNDYYFQTLCLLFFPGEKFRLDDAGVNRASFLLCKRNGSYYSEVRLVSGDKSAFASFDTDGYTPSIPMDEEFFATAALGKAFLLAGSRLFGFELPWGYLTGLRPVKRAKYYLDRGYSPELVSRLFAEDYNVFDSKTVLSVETALTEERMLEGIGPNDCGLYVSIPFCPTRCDYCSFVSYSNAKLFGLIPEYLERLHIDIERTARLIKELGMNIKSIYIGGGTPSILDVTQTDALLDCIVKNIRPDSGTEFTFEGGRPDTLTLEKMRAVYAHGVGRISINPQSTSDAVLQKIGRHHTSDMFFAAVNDAKTVGFDCMNADLIAGLPGDTDESFARSLDDVISLGFENITVHTLSIKNAAPIRFIDNGYYDPSGDFARRSVSYAYDTLKSKNYSPYYLYRQKNTVGNAENTGYSVSGKENLYNVLMMEEYSTVFACGAGSITKLVDKTRTVIDRIAFPKYPFEYLREDKGIGADRAKEFFADNRKEDTD